MDASELHILLNSEPVDCLFCAQNLQKYEGITLLQCLHTFCRDCLRTCIMENKDENVKCPTDCGEFLLHREIKQILGSALYKEYSERSLEVTCSSLRLFHCHKKGCRGMAECDNDRKVFICFVCETINCIKCQAIHEDISCSQYKRLYDEFKANGKSDEEAKMDVQEHCKTKGLAQLKSVLSPLVGRNSSHREYQDALDNLTATGVMFNDSVFECSICITNVAPYEGIIIQECLHMFCKECLARCIESAEDPSVACPHVEHDGEKCSGSLKSREIKALVSNTVYEKLLSLSVKQAEARIANTFHCMTADCPGWCEIDGNVTLFQCEVCRKPNCLNCRVIHENQDCFDYNNSKVQNENEKISETTLHTELNMGRTMRCPYCKIIIERIDGCDHMVCGSCRGEFNWAPTYRA